MTNTKRYYKVQITYLVELDEDQNPVRLWNEYQEHDTGIPWTPERAEDPLSGFLPYDNTNDSTFRALGNIIEAHHVGDFYGTVQEVSTSIERTDNKDWALF